MLVEKETEEDLMITEDDESGMSEETSGKKKRVENLKQLEEIPNDMPKFLMRVSSTYFKGSNDLKGFFKKKKRYSQVKEYSPPPPPTIEEIEKKAEEDHKKKQIAQELQRYTQKLDNSIVVEASVELEKQTPRTEKFSFHRKDESRMSMAESINRSMSVNTCLVCFDKNPDTVFFNCGHGGLCYECSLDVWKKTGECYLCRTV